MPSSTEQFVITIPLSRADRAKAEAAASYRISAEQKSAYRNALAVLATHYYLRMIEIPTEVENSACFDPENLTDTADLFVPMSHGRLECRPVQAGEDKGYVPPSVWSDRIGYVFVQLDDAGLEANILGFVSQVSVEQLPLSYLQSLDDLIDRVWGDSSIEQPDLGLSLAYRIGRWLEHKIASGWQLATDWRLTTLDSYSALEYRSRSSSEHKNDDNNSAENFWRVIEDLWVTDPKNPAGGSRIEKDISGYFGGQPIGLKTVIVEDINEKLAIQIRVFSRVSNTQLPSGIRLRGLTADGACFSQVESRISPLDDYIRICFIAETQEGFQIEVTWNSYSFIESFPSLEFLFS